MGAALLFATEAAAHGDFDVDRPTPDAAGSPATPASPASPESAAGDQEPPRPARFTLWLDGVLGWGKTPFAVQNLPNGGSPDLTYTRSDRTPTDVQSFILGGSAKVAPHVGVGVRLPFAFATFSPQGSEARAATALGNIELAGEYSLPLAAGITLVGRLGLTLPTAPGTAIPAGLNQADAATVDVASFDRWSLGRAASYARGYEEDELFEPQRLGIVPKVALRYAAAGFVVEPYVKVANLIGTSNSLDASYVGELVGGLRVGYWLSPHVELALRGWVNGVYAGAAADKTTAAALEPQVFLRFGPVLPFAGVIVPFEGAPSEGSFFGVRLGLAGRF